ncbi:hypothetical protein CRYUN_Cryun04dG0118300 [Craigia yunnanensis]
MFPEVKLKPEAQGNKDKTASEQTDREYLVQQSQDVFLGEVCDDLGGEFCEPEYQTGVYCLSDNLKKSKHLGKVTN